MPGIQQDPPTGTPEEPPENTRRLRGDPRRIPRGMPREFIIPPIVANNVIPGGPSPHQNSGAKQATPFAVQTLESYLAMRTQPMIRMWDSELGNTEECRDSSPTISLGAGPLAVTNTVMNLRDCSQKYSAELL